MLRCYRRNWTATQSDAGQLKCAESRMAYASKQTAHEQELLEIKLYLFVSSLFVYVPICKTVTNTGNAGTRKNFKEKKDEKSALQKHKHRKKTKREANSKKRTKTEQWQK